MAPSVSQKQIFAGGGEMGERIRSIDWSTTVLGPVDRWPESLKTAVRLCIGSRNPTVIWWGRSALTQLYNDSYIPILGAAKHPQWLGRSGRECWSEIWETMGPMWDRVFETGEAVWCEDFLYVLNRDLPREEGYFTFSYTPLQDDAGIVEGIFCTCYESTGRVVGERRLRTLRDLGRTITTAETEEACQFGVTTLAHNPHDISFALIYLLENDGQEARLIAATGIDAGTEAAPRRIALNKSAPDSKWPLSTVLQTGLPELVPDLAARFGPLLGGAWPDPSEAALVLPIAATGESKPTGFLVAGLSPRRPVDADYRSFVDLVAGHIGTAVSNARAYEQERKRAEALAELDRAKTTFFSNISHELRTPLTLVLGPTESALSSPQRGLTGADLEMAHRNELRLLKLVNALLDFSRIEAGRVAAKYEPTDISRFTKDLVSEFRSAVEQVGLRLIIDCPPLPDLVYIDRDMWEKIVLNLVSNAFKSTFEGEIEVAVKSARKRVELTVRDTGTGITKDEIPHLFDRFHRIEGARRRTHEGTGIGLALVQELVKLHAGSVAVDSEVDKGTTFTISIPMGTAHLPADRISAARELSSTTVGANAYVLEALSWLPKLDGSAAAGEIPGLTDIESGTTVVSGTAGKANSGRVLVVDDNRDMREYAARLLGSRFEVLTAENGKVAVERAQKDAPELVLTDIMMPEMDGFELLAAVRNNPATATIPVIFISARAGEESKVQGLRAGADDYLVKPFTADELLARVQTHIDMARRRRQAEQVLRESELWLTAQKEAFQAAMNGLPLAASLDILVRAAIRQMGNDTRCAFYIVDASGTELHHITGMPESYARCVDGFRIGPESLACGLAVHHGQPLITPDVREEPRWKSWLWLAGKYGYCGCWSFPVETSAGKMVGTFAMYFREPRQATARDLELAAVLTHTAAIIISRHQEAEARARIQQQLRKIEKLAAAGQLAASLAHEINNPLSSITNVLYLLETNFDLNDRARSMVAIASTELARVSRIVKQSLSYYRRGAVPQEFDLGETVEESLQVFGEKIQQAGVRISKKIAPRALVMGFADEIRQVIDNLLLNALEATPASGRLAVCVHPSRKWSNHQRGVRLTIGDSGCGIPRQNLSRIFEPFFTTKPEKGTGLGLWVLRGIVAKHDGEIRVRSKVGSSNSGTVISILWPACEGATPKSEPDPTALRGAAPFPHSSIGV